MSQTEKAEAERRLSRAVALDPRTKIALALALTALAFAVNSLPVAAAQALLAILLAPLAGAPLRRVFPRPGLLAAMIAGIVLMQALFRGANGGRYLLNPIVPEAVPLLGGLGALSVAGALAGLAIACRLVAVSALMPLLVITTEARSLAYGITRLGANYRVAHVITSTLNLAQSFEDALATITAARALRGAQPRGLRARLAEYGAIALPLMVKVMRRSSAVALAMDSRAFGARRRRTWLVETRMGRADFAVLAAGLAWAAATVAASLALGERWP